MTNALNQAIEDALASPAYRERAILINTLLDATSPLYVNERLLYRAVYTIFRALPERLVPATTLEIATTDLPGGGIEIFWEGKERLLEMPADVKELREVMGHGPHGDLVEIALLALERFCQMHAGYMDTRRELTQSSSFSRPAYVVRRVVAVLPGAPPAPSGFIEPTVPETERLRRTSHPAKTPGRHAMIRPRARRPGRAPVEARAAPRGS